MRSRSLTAALLLTAASAALLATLGPSHEDDTTPAAKSAAAPPRLLPGLQADGYVQLPNQWRLRPAGSQLELGDFPVNVAVHPDGRFLAVLHAGYRDHEIVHAFDCRNGYLGNHHELRIADAKDKHVPGGLAVSPDGRTLAVCGTWG